MFKYAIFLCLVAAAFAEPGILNRRVGVIGAPVLSAAPIGVIRSPIVAPIGGGLIAGGRIGGGLIAGGRIGGGLIAGGRIGGGLVTGGLIH